MRASKILMATAMTTAIFALGACGNSDEPEVVDITKPISLDFGLTATQTRVTIEDDASFETGNSIGIYMGEPQNDDAKGVLGSLDKYNNVKYTYDGDSWSGDAIYWQNTSQYHMLYAYSPYDGAMSQTNTTIEFELKADQLDGANYKAVDFLWKSTAPVKARTDALPMVLEHKMSLIKVTITRGNDMTSEELAAMDMVINAPNGIKAKGEFDLKTGTCKAASEQGVPSALTTVNPYRTGNVFYAIVMPGTTFTNGDDFVTLTALDATPYIYKLSVSGDGSLAMVGGKKYEFTLKANKVGIELIQFTIDSWDAGSGDDNGNADMVVPTHP